MNPIHKITPENPPQFPCWLEHLEHGFEWHAIAPVNGRLQDYGYIRWKAKPTADPSPPAAKTDSDLGNDADKGRGPSASELEAVIKILATELIDLREELHDLKNHFTENSLRAKLANSERIQGLLAHELDKITLLGFRSPEVVTALAAHLLSKHQEEKP